MREYYQKTPQQVMEDFRVTDQGLNDAEIISRRQKYGFNVLDEGAGLSIVAVFLEQMKDFLVLILIAAAVTSAFLGKFESALVILVVIIINAVLGATQHIKAESSLKSLKALSSPTAKILREGNKIEIPSKEVLPGDILFLEAGDYISADGRLLKAFSLQINESSLTGESISVSKDASVIDNDHITMGDRINMVFAGSFVTNGRATIVVTAIGMNTEIGKIANLLEQTKEKQTPLQRDLEVFGKKLAVVIVGICILIFGLNLYREQALVEAFMFAVALAVAAIPEALSSIVTIVLAFGTQKMAKESAIIRKLHAVESLGSISVICSDKTGTLTQNRMTVQKVFVNGNVLNYDAMNHDNQLEKRLVLMALLCNDAITMDDKEMGDPTELALVNLGSIYHLDELNIRDEYPRLGEIPFDSERKLMSTVHQVDGKAIMITKGALDVVLIRSSEVQLHEQIQPLEDEYRNYILGINKEFSQNGLRVLAFASKHVEANHGVTLDDERDLVFLGLIAMMDPPREQSAAAVASCISAGIKPVMITGDHRITAAAIARQIGILKEESEAIDGAEIEKWEDAELCDRVGQISVYARVSPEHKIRIVRAWQEKGNVVAMTGDGVNDAPALKQADIGIAMGITGTEVAKDAASMVLTDDNFSTIVKAIANGRSIYVNIKNAIRFLLSGNMAGILSVVYASILALPVPFAPVHLLFINLITDSLPAIAIGLEPHNERIMQEKPRGIKEPILSMSFGFSILVEGFIMALCTMAAFHIGLVSGGHSTASTMAFATLCLTRLLHGFNSRSNLSIIKIGLFTNLYLWSALIIGYLLLKFVLTYPPMMRIFEVASLGWNDYILVYGLSILPLIVIQLGKSLFIKN